MVPVGIRSVLQLGLSDGQDHVAGQPQFVRLKGIFSAAAAAFPATIVQNENSWYDDSKKE
jgi:hypothetical protein